MASCRTDLVVAFDLDMTLIDSRPSVEVSLRALSAELGRSIDVDHIVNNLGPPITELLGDAFAPGEIEAAVDRYLEIYLEIGVPVTRMLVGANEAVESVHQASGSVAVITAKSPRTAQISLEQVGIHVDRVHAGRHGSGKRDAILEARARLYVGDTPSDMRAARDANAHALGVATGPFVAEELMHADADGVIETLREFPEYLEKWMPGQPV